MRQPGRKSAASLSMIPLLPHEQRPEPPKELTRDQATEWREIVDRMPSDWFSRETHGLLVQYCRHVVRARQLAVMINAISPKDLVDRAGLLRYEKLMGLAGRESGLIVALGTKMRITQQSRYEAKTAARSHPSDEASSRQPWKFVA